MQLSVPWGLVDARPIVARVGSGDRGAAAIAAEQHGVMSVEQLYFVGLSRKAVMGRTHRGLIHRMHRGVYAVGHRAVGDLGRLAAALLATGPGSAVSHRPAAFLLEMLGSFKCPIDVSLARRSGHRRSRDGIQLHQPVALETRDLQRRGVIPVTTPVRTLIDLAETEPELLEPALNEGRAKRLFSPRDLDRAIDLHTARFGAARLRALLTAESDPGFSRNRAERMLAVLLRRAALPPPQRNRSIHGIELDFFWADQGVNVELDGFSTHGQRRRNFERDRDRDAMLASRGIQVIRVTWWQLTREAPKVVARIAAALALRSGTA